MSFFARLAHQKSANAGDAPPQAVSASIARATDVDEFVQTVRGYHLGFMQIDKGPFVAEVVQTQLAGVLLSAVHYGRALVHSGEFPSGKVTFAVGTSKVPALWQGRRFGPYDLLAVKPGAEIDVVSQAQFGVATASFPPELVKETAHRLGLIAQGPTSLVFPLEHNRGNMLRATLAAAINEVAARPFNERAATWALSKQEDLLRVLLQCISNSAPPIQSVSNGERARVLKAALAVINDRPEDALTVSDLCRIARASERTLHHAFTERFGLAPAYYMKARRLNGVRNDLYQEHEPSMKIADVASKWGFWHLGQFARDYRSWFGELPSDTHQRKHGNNPHHIE